MGQSTSIQKNYSGYKPTVIQAPSIFPCFLNINIFTEHNAQFRIENQEGNACNYRANKFKLGIALCLSHKVLK